jgi:hypothetical protein
MRLEDVATEVLECWRATLTSSNRTVAKHLVILHGIFRRAMKVWVTEAAARVPTFNLGRLTWCRPGCATSNTA